MPGENPYGIPFKINENWSGELLVNLHMGSLNNPFKIHWKLVWNAPSQFTYGILKEFLSKTVGNWSGELLVNLKQFPIDFKKLVWRAPGQFTCGNIKDFMLASLILFWSPPD